MALRGNPQTLRALAKSMRQLPKTVAQDVAKRVAPVITDKAQAAYSGGVTVYGDPRPAGVHGNALDLIETGDTQARVHFVAIGTVVRCVLPTRQARFLIGKYRIMPLGALPVAWSEAIGAEVNAEIERNLARAAA